MRGAPMRLVKYDPNKNKGEKHHGRTRYLRGVRAAIVWSLMTWAGLLFLVTRCGR